MYIYINVFYNLANLNFEPTCDKRDTSHPLWAVKRVYRPNNLLHLQCRLHALSIREKVWIKIYILYDK